MKQLLLLLLLSFFSSSSLSVSLSPLTVLASSVHSFFSSFLGTYRLSHCWIFILQPQTLRSHHHFFLFFFSLSLARSLYHDFRRLLLQHFSLYTFSDCSFCIFFSLCAFCFCLCTLESSSLLTLLYVMDNLLSCHPLNTCCQPLSFENVIGFCSLFSQIF